MSSWQQKVQTCWQLTLYFLFSLFFPQLISPDFFLTILSNSCAIMITFLTLPFALCKYRSRAGKVNVLPLNNFLLEGNTCFPLCCVVKRRHRLVWAECLGLSIQFNYIEWVFNSKTNSLLFYIPHEFPLPSSVSNFTNECFYTRCYI